MTFSLIAQVALGSALIHAEEFMSPDGHPADQAAFESCMRNQEIQDWLKDMTKEGLLPVKRKED